jgi:hypothetical protein
LAALEQLVTAEILFLPSTPRCELCPLGIAAISIDSVWCCQECAEVLGVSPAAMRTPGGVWERPAAPKPSLLEVIDSVLRTNA